MTRRTPKLVFLEFEYLGHPTDRIDNVSVDERARRTVLRYVRRYTQDSKSLTCVMDVTYSAKLK